MAFLKNHFKKLILVLVVLCAAAGGIIFYSMQHKNSEPEVVVEPNETFKDIADEEIEFDPQKESRDLKKSIFVREHLFKLNASSYQLLTPPGKRTRYARIIFYLQVKKEKDLDYLEFNEPLILETIGTILRSMTPEDCEGVEGKEKLRLKLVEALNQKLSVVLVNVRYGAFTVL